ncbi:MAG: MBL fold metallo-hydrolase [Minisyncoccota bacterium]
MEILPFHATRGCLSYLIIDESSREAALIDPSTEIEAQTYLSTLEERGATLRYLIETHTHADHISSAPELARATGAKLVRHSNAPSRRKDIAVAGGEELPLGTNMLHVLATPGHTDESISIVADTAVFTGDALLIGSTGRTDFQLGSSEALYASLHETLGSLPEETVVYPAHDYKNRTASTIGEEKRSNARFALTRDAFIETLDAHHPPAPDLFVEAIAENSR